MSDAANRNSLLSPAETARLLAVPEMKVHALVQAGVLPPAFKLVREPRYLREDVERLAACCSGGTHHHAVQFFEDESFLARVVADFLGEGLGVDAPLIVIARPARLGLFTRKIEEKGHVVSAAIARGQLTLLDAHETLARFMSGGMPDPRRFRTAIGPLIEQKRREFPRARLRAYGEMVDILWSQGNADAAIRLEELWNELSRAHPFSLLCAYCMDNFDAPDSAEHFVRVCDRHSDVVPAESNPVPDADEPQRREIARLQQAVNALKAELRASRASEAALRAELGSGGTRQAA